MLTIRTHSRLQSSDDVMPRGRRTVDYTPTGKLKTPSCYGDFNKRKAPAIFAAWDGAPKTVLLRNGKPVS